MGWRLKSNRFCCRLLCLLPVGAPGFLDHIFLRIFSTGIWIIEATVVVETYYTSPTRSSTKPNNLIELRHTRFCLSETVYQFFFVCGCNWNLFMIFFFTNLWRASDDVSKNFAKSRASLPLNSLHVGQDDEFFWSWFFFLVAIGIFIFHGLWKTPNLPYLIVKWDVLAS